MDPVAEVIGMVVVCAAAVVIVKVLANAVVAYTAQQREEAVSARAHIVDGRLDRLEAAIDAVALEVERVGESQRFADQRAGARRSPPASAQLPVGGSTSPPRIVTPH